MRTALFAVVAVLTIMPFFSSAACMGAGLESAGNVDGVLTWRLGTLEKDKPAREVVFFVFDSSYDAVFKQLEAARRQFAKQSPPAIGSPQPPASKVWIQNAATDFALEGPCFFRWRMERQALRCPRGGQLSQFTWYVHYKDGAGEHRAGTTATARPKTSGSSSPFMG